MSKFDAPGFRTSLAERVHTDAITAQEAIQAITKGDLSPDAEVANAFVEFQVARAKLDMVLAKHGRPPYGAN